MMGRIDSAFCMYKNSDPESLTFKSLPAPYKLSAMSLLATGLFVFNLLIDRFVASGKWFKSTSMLCKPGMLVLTRVMATFVKLLFAGFISFLLLLCFLTERLAASMRLGRYLS